MKIKLMLAVCLSTFILNATELETQIEACKNGDAKSCYTSGLTLTTGENAEDQEKKTLGLEYLRKGCKYGEEKGVMVALQNHNEFLFTSDEIIDIIKRVDSEWFGLILDIGSLHAENPYDEIEKLAPYANYWFVKEYVYPNRNKTPVEMKKIAAIMRHQGYQGYISFESLSDGDPKQIITSMFNSFKAEYETL